MKMDSSQESGVRSQKGKAGSGGGGQAQLRVVCSWCGKVMAVGDAPSPVSHSICEPCVLARFGPEMAREVREMAARRGQLAEAVA
jgi:hypothetical protein